MAFQSIKNLIILANMEEHGLHGIGFTSFLFQRTYLRLCFINGETKGVWMAFIIFQQAVIFIKWCFS